MPSRHSSAVWWMPPPSATTGTPSRSHSRPTASASRRTRDTASSRLPCSSPRRLAGDDLLHRHHVGVKVAHQGFPVARTAPARPERRRRRRLNAFTVANRTRSPFAHSGPKDQAHLREVIHRLGQKPRTAPGRRATVEIMTDTWTLRPLDEYEPPARPHPDEDAIRRCRTSAPAATDAVPIHEQTPAPHGTRPHPGHRG
jgi:antitoxin (DNA-binding transcriptional repressor) of toxin-antitoxin stability system